MAFEAGASRESCRARTEKNTILRLRSIYFQIFTHSTRWKAFSGETKEHAEPQYLANRKRVRKRIYRITKAAGTRACIKYLQWRQFWPSIGEGGAKKGSRQPDASLFYSSEVDFQIPPSPARQGPAGGGGHLYR